jgi:GMP synthase (glutamine-hydrolysing)
MSVNVNLRMCVINGYPEPNRQVLADTGISQAHELYLDFLRRHAPNAAVDILYAADLHVALPTASDLAFYDAYIWTGSNLTIYDDDPRVTRQIDLARAIYEVGRPCYGSCWGVQMAAVAAGGEVRKNPKGREWAIARDVQLTEDGLRSPLYLGKPSRFNGFIMHLDEVTRVPPGGRILATNAHTRVQALEVRHGKGVFWATQYHPEYTLYEMARLLIARREALVKEGFFKDTGEIERLSDRMIELSRHPGSEELQAALGIGSDLLDPRIREQELRNWIDHLVLPSLAR